MERDNFSCVICADRYSLVVHHIVERRLWPDGGYYMENGATLCAGCHLEAESTVLGCEEIRKACGISKALLPEQYYDDIIIDKWGNYILSNGTKLRGELFYDESVAKILANKDQFVDYVKYPRTYHFPWSNPSKDDRVIKNLGHFHEKEVVVTEKRDGENTTMYRDYIHARSLGPLMGEDRGLVKALHSKIKFDIPEGWRICGENLYAVHSIRYENLPSVFEVFSIWDEKNNCLSWDETLEYCSLLGLTSVPELYRGIYNEELIKNISIDTEKQEGYVMRLADSFSYFNFKNNVVKMVRKNHVTSSNHWRHQKIEANSLSHYP